MMGWVDFAKLLRDATVIIVTGALKAIDPRGK
jgi:hypothetical protein